MAIAPTAPSKLRPVISAETVDDSRESILLLGVYGTGKSSQITTLPGRKFVYAFDPNTIGALKGYKDIDLVEFFAVGKELELRLKGFNQNSLTDRSGKKIEPILYEEWREDHDARLQSDFWAKNDYQWICLESYTWFIEALEARQMWLDNRPGESTDTGDHQQLGFALTRNFQSLQSTKCNLFLTGHLRSYQDLVTKQIRLYPHISGKAKSVIPSGCTNVWISERGKEPGKFNIRTIPEPQGFQLLRSRIPGLKELEDVTIPMAKASDGVMRFVNPQSYGIGRLLKLAAPRAALSTAV